MLKGLDGSQGQRGQQRRHRAAAGPGRRAVDPARRARASFTQNLAARDQLIGDVINNLNTVLGTVDEKGAQFDASVDQLQQLHHRPGREPRPDRRRDPAAGVGHQRPDRACCRQSRRPMQGVIENLRPLAQRMDERKARRQQGHRAAGGELPAAQRTRRVRLVLQHLLLLDPDEDQRTRGQRHPDSVRRSAGSVQGEVLGEWLGPARAIPLRTGIFGIALVACLVLVSFGYTGLPFWPQGKNYEAYFTDAGGITPGNDVNVSGIKVGKVNSVELAGDSAKVKFTVEPEGQGRRPVPGGDQDRHRARPEVAGGDAEAARAARR